MEEIAKEYVLQNIKAAIYNRKRLKNELRSYTVCPSLSEFIANNGQDIRLIYKNNLCWTKLKKYAGFATILKTTIQDDMKRDWVN